MSLTSASLPRTRLSIGLYRLLSPSTACRVHQEQGHYLRCRNWKMSQGRRIHEERYFVPKTTNLEIETLYYLKRYRTLRKSYNETKGWTIKRIRRINRSPTANVTSFTKQDKGNQKYVCKHIDSKSNLKRPLSELQQSIIEQMNPKR